MDSPHARASESESRRSRRPIAVLSSVCCAALLLFLGFAWNSIGRDGVRPPTTAVTRRRSLRNHDLWLYSTDRTMSISRTNKLVYVHIPKTGGSTLELSRLFDDAKEHHEIGGHYHLNHMMHSPVRRAIDDFAVFSVVRHPCERFISAFYYLKLQGNPGDKATAEYFDIRGKGLGIVDWVDMLAEREARPGWKWVAAESKVKHFEKQLYYAFYPWGQFGLDRLFCQEHFEDSISWLRDTYGEPFHSHHVPERRKHGKFQHEHCSELPDRTREWIEKAYAIDYCIFGYETGKFGADAAKEEGACIGDRLQSKEDFTRRYHDCKASIAQQ